MIIVRSQRSKPRVLAGVFAMAFGAWLAIDGLIDISRGIASDSWPTTEATLSGIQVVDATRLAARDFWPRDVEVNYWYSAAGQRYTSSQIAFGDELKSLLTPEIQAGHLRNERPLLAHYDPHNPKRAVLHAGVTLTAILWMAIGVLSLLGGYVTATGVSSLPGVDAEWISSATKLLENVREFLFDR